MDVIGHQAGSEKRQFPTLLSARHERDERRVVSRLVKYRGLAVGAIDDVVALIGEYPAWWARHPATVSRSPPRSSAQIADNTAISRAMRFEV
jgi:hypothetical protein